MTPPEIMRKVESRARKSAEDCGNPGSYPFQLGYLASWCEERLYEMTPEQLEAISKKLERESDLKNEVKCD